MWLTTAVAQAQGDAPGVTAAVHRVAKPVVAQAATAVSGGAAVAQRVAFTATAVAQRTGSDAKGASASQPHKPAPVVTVPTVDVPAPPAPVSVAALPLPPVDVSPAPVAQEPADVDEAVAALAGVPAAVASTAVEAEAIANAVGDDATVDEHPAAADTASTEFVERFARSAIADVPALPQVAALPGQQVESLIETAFDAHAAGTDLVPLEAAANDIGTSAIRGGLDGLPIRSSVEQLAASVGSATTEPSEPKTPVAAPSLPNSPREQGSPTAAHESIAHTSPIAPIVPSTLNRAIAQESASQAAIAASTPNQWAILGPAEGLRAARNSPIDSPEVFGPGQSAFAPPVLMVAPSTAAVFDVLRTGPGHNNRFPFDTLAPPGAASPAPAQSSPSTVLGSSGNSPGAVSPFQLSLLPFTAWRTLARQGSGHPASIVLPNLAPPG
jgi:hypothetical protein